MRNLADYRQIVGDDAIHSICLKARNLYGKHVLHLNSTYQGGGVAEMLVSLLPLMNDTGLDAGWRILHGHPDFFTITKKFHNALQGEAVNLTPIKKRLYVQANEDFSVIDAMLKFCRLCTVLRDQDIICNFHKDFITSLPDACDICQKISPT